MTQYRHALIRRRKVAETAECFAARRASAKRRHGVEGERRGRTSVARRERVPLAKRAAFLP